MDVLLDEKVEDKTMMEMTGCNNKANFTKDKHTSHSRDDDDVGISLLESKHSH